jgi:hypothetical protein
MIKIMSLMTQPDQCEKFLTGSTQNRAITNVLSSFDIYTPRSAEVSKKTADNVSVDMSELSNLLLALTQFDDDDLPLYSGNLSVLRNCK